MIKKHRISVFKKPIMFALAALTSAGCLASINAQWVETKNVPKDENVSTNTLVKSEPVCYFTSGGIKYYFSSIEGALTKAASGNYVSTSETIYVIPNTNPTIYSNCTIDTKDTLCLPYDGETYMRDLSGITKNNVSTIQNANFADTNSTFLKNNVTLSSSKVLTINGKLIIGGQLGIGSNNQRPSGHTNGLYCKITLDDKSSIINNGTIDCYGYIKEKNEYTETRENMGVTPYITCSNGSSIYMPMVILDYRGGSFSAAANSQGVFPFSVFELQNIQTNVVYNSGAILYARTVLYANDKTYVPDSTVLLSQSNGIFQISSGNISIRYRPYSFEKGTINDNKSTQSASEINKMIIKISGNVSFGSMLLSLAGTSFNTSSFHLPISYKFDIKCCSGSTLNLPYKIKFLSGSKLSVDSGSTLTISNECMFYQSYTCIATTGDANLYPRSLGPATFIVNGTANLNSKFAGYIDTSALSGKVITSTNFTANVSCYELVSAGSGGTSWKYREITGYAVGLIQSDLSSDATKAQFIKNQTYNANQESWIGSLGSTTSTIETIGDEQSGSCLLFDSLVLTTNNSYKKAGELKVGDIVMTFNHETGVFEASQVIINDDIDKDATLYNVVTLNFSDGNKADLVYEHGFFDLTLNKYVYIREDNYNEFIGHDFVEVDSSGNNLTTKPVKLNSVSVHEEYTKVCSPVTANNLNIVSDNMLSIAGGISGFFNIFEYEKDTLKFDPIKKQADIDKYGLLDYSYFEDLIPYEVYEVLPCKYLGVAIGKGLITWDEIYAYAKRWGSQLVA